MSKNYSKEEKIKALRDVEDLKLSLTQADINKIARRVEQRMAGYDSETQICDKCESKLFYIEREIFVADLIYRSNPFKQDLFLKKDIVSKVDKTRKTYSLQCTFCTSKTFNIELECLEKDTLLLMIQRNKEVSFFRLAKYLFYFFCFMLIYKFYIKR